MRIFPAKTSYWQRVRGSEGYTLLELLVVLAIMALLVSVAPAVYGRIVPGYQVRQFSNELANHMRDLRERARTNGTIEIVRFVKDSETMVVAGTGLEFPTSLKVVFEPNEVWQSTVEDQLFFYANGASSGGRVTVKRGGLSVVLNIDWISGAVEVLQ